MTAFVFITMFGLAAGATVDTSAQTPTTLCAPCERSLQLQADALEARAQELDARQADLVARERALDAYKARFKAQLDPMVARIAEMERMLDIGEGARQAHEQRMAALAETLTTLSAKKAAPMLATTDPALVGNILLRLGAARSAALLALMPPNRAARFLEQVGDGGAKPLPDSAPTQGGKP